MSKRKRNGTGMLLLNRDGVHRLRNERGREKIIPGHPRYASSFLLSLLPRLFPPFFASDQLRNIVDVFRAATGKEKPRRKRMENVVKEREVKQKRGSIAVEEKRKSG